MKLVMAVINSVDAEEVASALVKAGYPATVTESYGAFLGKKNNVLFSGVEEKRVTAVIDIIEEHTNHRDVEVDADSEVDAAGYKLPPHVRVGGAAVFVLDVDRFVEV